MNFLLAPLVVTFVMLAASGYSVNEIINVFGRFFSTWMSSISG